ncbi:MAG: toxin-antitoxin system HicB family antitoxin [Halioglobus sp.]|jgi:predicted HicB family RNase H-like nuclease|nr:toxin-antitoxin system HicB family antitoxin [Halioglobus sp.]
MDVVNAYSYRVLWSEEDQEHVGLCTELPSLSHLDEDFIGAAAGIRSLVASVVADMQEHGEVVPEPLSLRKYSGKFVVRVAPEQHRELAMDAAEAGVSLNQLAVARLAHT